MAAVIRFGPAGGLAAVPGSTAAEGPDPVQAVVSRSTIDHMRRRPTSKRMTSQLSAHRNFSVKYLGIDAKEGQSWRSPTRARTAL